MKSDVEDGMHVLVSAFGAGSVDGSRVPMTAEPHKWLIAHVDGTAAGVVTSNAYGRVAYVAMLAVREGYRRRGVATAVMTRLMDDLAAEGVATILLDATAQAEALYGSLGFRETDRTRIYVRAAPPPTGDASPHVTDDALAHAIRFDETVYGCDRSELLRRFARFPYAFAAVEGGGFAMTRGPVVGPFAADDSRTAARLIETVLRRRPHLERAFVPASNPHAHAIFERHGFACGRSIAHMQFGAPSPFRRDRIYSQASLGHG
jgi:N-acetylglutamate synthase-like GNAT family acetyltransferase